MSAADSRTPARSRAAGVAARTCIGERLVPVEILTIETWTSPTTPEDAIARLRQEIVDLVAAAEDTTLGFEVCCS